MSIRYCFLFSTIIISLIFSNNRYFNHLQSMYNYHENPATIVDESTTDLQFRQLEHASFIYKKAAPSTVLIITPTSMGSGVIINNSQIITNVHVVDGYEYVAIVLYNEDLTSNENLNFEDFIEAEVIAVDITRDLAMLQLNSKSLSNPIQLADNRKIRIGDDVAAIGHPASLWTFTSGMISALPKNKVFGEEDQSRANCIQTDADLNGGNSGGPLLDYKARLVGINTWVQFGESGGLNFAVRLNEVTDFISKANDGQYIKYTEPTCKFSNAYPTYSKKILGISEDLDVDSGVFQDCDSSGYSESLVIFLNDDDQDLPDLEFIDINEDGNWDAIHFIDDKTFYIDQDFDGQFDHIGYDYDGDWFPEEIVEHQF